MEPPLSLLRLKLMAAALIAVEADAYGGYLHQKLIGVEDNHQGSESQQT
jgi:hypothetical protein